ncbi:MAG: pyridoxal phosphate-dependent aminotransferase [bacterium]|nr:pyridoxal phosphate-dependent aminotransferase [bacterium]
MRKSNLPPAGGNLFQGIKQKCDKAQADGIKLIKLSIGQPKGPALEPARIAAAKAIMSDKESMHEYQDNGSPGVPNFALKFVQAHVKTNLPYLPEGSIDFLPIPGMKPMFGMVIDAMGGWCDPGKTYPTVVGTMTKPGYPTPADQCLMRPHVEHLHLSMDPKNGFLFNPGEVIGKMSGEPGNKLLMLNFPHNPTGIVAKRKWLRELCGLCEKHGVYVCCDSAYSILSHTDEATTLTDIAVEFPDLNWAEAFSASKSGNNTGWRIGAMIGSPEFISDIKRIKGNTDSGFAAPLAAGILDLYENHMHEINAVRSLYKSRLDLVTDILEGNGMRLAVRPEGGFFLLFDCPKKAFGQGIASSDHFNDLMIANAGIVGVPFDPWIRYAVCAADIEEVKGEISCGFEKAEVSY